MVKEVDAAKFAGDKIYGSKNNRKILRASKIKTRLMYKASKHKPLLPII
jgi:IS5 family transposase